MASIDLVSIHRARLSLSVSMLPSCEQRQADGSEVRANRPPQPDLWMNIFLQVSAITSLCGSVRCIGG